MSQSSDGKDGAGGGITALARECLVKCDGDWERAAKLMRRRLDRDPALMAELLNPLIDGQIWYQIRGVAHKARHPGPITSGEDTGLPGIKGRAHRMLDWPLRAGVLLSKAKRAEIIVEAEWYETLATANAIKARWFRMIERKLGGGRKSVEAVLSEEELRKLWDRAEK